MRWRCFTYAMSPEDRHRYEEELKHDRDALNMLDTARERGIEQGRQEGKPGRVFSLEKVLFALVYHPNMPFLLKTITAR